MSAKNLHDLTEPEQRAELERIDDEFARLYARAIAEGTERDVRPTPYAPLDFTERPVPLTRRDLPPDGPKNPPKMRGEAQRLAEQQQRERRRDFAIGLRLRRSTRPRPDVGRFEIVDLREGDCRFVTDDAPFLFCGDETAPGSPYCAAHHRRCFRPRPKLPPLCQAM
jgi:hypothetical protein